MDDPTHVAVGQKARTPSIIKRHAQSQKVILPFVLMPCVLGHR